MRVVCDVLLAVFSYTGTALFQHGDLRGLDTSALVRCLFQWSDECAYHIPNPYATLVHQDKGTEYPR